jgi:hypothetical protein
MIKPQLLNSILCQALLHTVSTDTDVTLEVAFFSKQLNNEYFLEAWVWGRDTNTRSSWVENFILSRNFSFDKKRVPSRNLWDLHPLGHPLPVRYQSATSPLPPKGEGIPRRKRSPGMVMNRWMPRRETNDRCTDGRFRNLLEMSSTTSSPQTLILLRLCDISGRCTPRELSLRRRITIRTCACGPMSPIV